MPISTAFFLKFLGKELTNPITCLVAFLIGAAINVFQGKEPEDDVTLVVIKIVEDS
jgi:hypothetical protein